MYTIHVFHVVSQSQRRQLPRLRRPRTAGLHPQRLRGPHGEAMASGGRSGAGDPGGCGGKWVLFLPLYVGLTMKYRDYMGLYGIIWDYMGLCGIMWDYVGLYGILWGIMGIN